MKKIKAVNTNAGKENGTVEIPLVTYDSLNENSRRLKELEGEAIFAIVEIKSVELSQIHGIELFPNTNSKTVMSELLASSEARYNVANNLAAERREKIMHLETSLDKWKEKYNEENSKKHTLHRRMDRIRNILSDKKTSKKVKLRRINNIAGEE